MLHNIAFAVGAAILLAGTMTTARAGEVVWISFPPTNDGHYMSWRSSTPKGGADYKTADEARKMKAEVEAKGLRNATVFQSSDLTGYFSIAGGTNPLIHKILLAVGYGKTQAEAEADALKQLTAKGATHHRWIGANFFSYGE